MNTLNESQIITLLPQDSVPELDVVARQICGQTVFIGWPHLVEARVVAVANNQLKYSLVINESSDGVVKEDNAVTKVQLTTREVDDWRASERDIKNRYRLVQSIAKSELPSCRFDELVLLTLKS